MPVLPGVSPKYFGHGSTRVQRGCHVRVQNSILLSFMNLALAAGARVVVINGPTQPHISLCNGRDSMADPPPATGTPSPPRPRRSRILPPTTALACQVVVMLAWRPQRVARCFSSRHCQGRTCSGWHRSRCRRVNGHHIRGLGVLFPWIPRFIGPLSLEGCLEDPGGGDEGSAPAGGDAAKIVPVSKTSTPLQTLVLENLGHGFIKPCILDVKL